jgi:hypothetical protein
LIEPEVYASAAQSGCRRAVKTTNVAERMVKGCQHWNAVNVGNNIYKVTNTFGIRSGANAVPGREGHHSKGMDMVGYSRDGKQVIFYSIDRQYFNKHT